MRRMTKLAERGKANIDVVVGAVQEAVGGVIGDRALEAKGAARQIMGQARREVAKLADEQDRDDAIEDEVTDHGRTERNRANVEVVAGAVQTAVGGAIGDDKMEADGVARQVEGHARNEAASKGHHRSH